MSVCQFITLNSEKYLIFLYEELCTIIHFAFVDHYEVTVFLFVLDTGIDYEYKKIRVEDDDRKGVYINVYIGELMHRLI